MPGVIKGRFSITVTSAPNLFQTDPISKPIYPPPITTKDFGTELNESAAVEEIMFFSSIFTPGNEEAWDPVAITIFFVLYEVFFSLVVNYYVCW